MTDTQITDAVVAFQWIAFGSALGLRLDRGFTRG